MFKLGTVIIIDGGRITIPKEYREKMKIKKGDFLTYEIINKKLILTYKISENPTKDLFGLAADVNDDIQGDDLFLEEIKTCKMLYVKNARFWVFSSIGKTCYV